MSTPIPQAEYIVKNGERTAVIVPIAEYEELLEDLHDLAVIARRMNEPTISLAEVKRRLKSNVGVVKRQERAGEKRTFDGRAEPA